MSSFTSKLEDVYFHEELALKKAVGKESAALEGAVLERGIVDSVMGKLIYRWNHTYVSPLAMADGLPITNLPSLKWGLKVAERVVQVLLNSLAIESDSATKAALKEKVGQLQEGIDRGFIQFDTLRSVVGDIALHGRLKGSDRPQSIEEYAEIFKVIGLPAVSSVYNRDSNFAAMRTAGPNPLLIERLTERIRKRFPLTGKQFRSVMKGDNYTAALREGRVYICDYKILDNQEQNTELPLKYLYAPIALFATHKLSGELVPVAIQCQQKPDKKTNPIYVADGSYDWLIAKTIVEMADGNYHEAVSHLGRTHLYIEPFVVATGRNLSKDHPVAKLLWPHFEGTLFINFAAVKSLLAPGGAVDNLLQGTIESTVHTTTAGVLDYPFNQAFLPKTFNARGVNDLKNYAFRDDSLLYWSKIKAWVTNYLQATYTQNPAEDKELIAWYDDLVSQNGGRVKGFGQNGGPIQTKEYLAKVLTMIIYTSSVQHAAVNFPQYDFMSYTPNMPLACYDQFPKTESGIITSATAQDALNILPTMDRAKEQLQVGFTLGSVHYTELGKYEAGQFDQAVTDGPLKKFQADLEGIDETINERNINRRPYKTLLSKGIPQSINI